MTLIVTDNFLSTSGLLDGILQGITERGIHASVFDEVTPDPTFPVVEAAAKAGENCDAVVAVGGGSVLDTAKAASASIANKKNPRQLVGLLKVRKYPLLCIAVPTTAGTGSETTVAAIISDPETHKKKQILDPKIVPVIAVLDPELTVGLPLSGTAFTAFDALTHAVESYISGYANEETKRRAKIAVKEIYLYLPRVMKNPSDLEAREALLEASFWAGTAFTRTYIGYVHAFAHNIGGQYHIPHGLANAVLLPHIMQYYLPRSWKNFAELASLVGLNETTPMEQAKKFVDSLFELSHTCNIPERFEAFPESGIDEIITAAFKEAHGVYPVPRYYNRKAARELLLKVCAK